MDTAEPWSQSRFPLHWVVQAVPLQAYGAHALLEVTRHVPAPSHVRAVVAVPAVQAALAHSVPLGHKRQPPLPSQVPSRPHVLAKSCVQLLFGSCPAGTGEQYPALPVRLQVVHMLVQAVSQQTPSTQKPRSHWLACVHATPTPSLPAASGVGDEPSTPDESSGASPAPASGRATSASPTSATIGTSGGACRASNEEGRSRVGEALSLPTSRTVPALSGPFVSPGP